MPDGSTPIASNPAQGFDARLIELGYEPVPTVGKAPKNDGWQTGEITVERIAAMRAAVPAAANTGLRTGRLVGVDIDLREPDHVEAIKRLAYDVLGFTAMERVGSKG